MILLAGVLVAPAYFGPRAGASQGNGQVRVLHALPGVPAVAVLGDGAPVHPALAYGADTGYLLVRAGSHRVSAAGPDGAELAGTVIDLRSGAAVTVVFGPQRGSTLLLVDESLAPVGGPALLRLAHRATWTEALSLAARDGPTFIHRVPPGAASDYVEAAPGASTLQVRDAVSGRPLADLPDSVLLADRTYTFVVVDSPTGGPPFALVPLLDG